MHSFHQSRGRILFEVLCALTISASCAAAWVQTGASAFLPAALAAALYGLWHLTDMAGRRPAVAAEPQALASVNEDQGDLLAYASRVEPPPAPAEPIEPEAVEPEAVEEASELAPKAKRPKRKKPAAKEEAADLPIVAMETEEAGEPAVVEIAEEHHPPIEPLFEPQPLVRQQRAVFGRKAG